MPPGLFYFEHMDLPKRVQVPIGWPPNCLKGSNSHNNAWATLPLNTESAAFR